MAEQHLFRREKNAPVGQSTPKFALFVQALPKLGRDDPTVFVLHRRIPTVTWTFWPVPEGTLWAGPRP
tara:strand:- start:168 stop:371 length:204 start_codon:yes stop_codon:yes gene_type:complete